MNTRILVPVCSVALCACSAASSGGNSAPMPRSDAGPDAGVDSGGSSGSGSSSGSDAGPKDPAECAHKSGCYGCCVADFSGGAQFYQLAELGCVCAGAGSCSQACTAEECSLLSSRNQSCENCLQARMSATCDKQAAAACAADATCRLYMQCLGGCQ